MVSWPLLLLLARAAARPTEASNDMKARFTAHLTRLRQRHDMKAAEAQFERQFHKKKSALLSPTANASRSANVELSVVILTYKNPQKLNKLIGTVVKQKTNLGFEVIVADNGCLIETREVMQAWTSFERPSIRRIELCDNPGYSRGNNRAAEAAAPTATRLLFLNDDMILMHDQFLEAMVRTAATRVDAVGVGCKLIYRNARGQTAVQEAGSIVWEDGSCHGFGRDQTRLDDPTLSFVRRIDFVSGACLLIDRGAFQTMGGFAADNYEAYYEDSDLQMRLKYKFGKYVYYQPLAVALHDEHGSFGGDTSVQLMRQGQQTFSKIWKQELTLNHLPYGNTPYLKLRAATRMHATKILYVDQLLPRHKIGSGFARAGDNVQLMARAFDGDAIVTAIGNEEVLANVEPELWTALRQNQVELQTHRCGAYAGRSCIRTAASTGRGGITCKSVQRHLHHRPGYYAFIVVSRPHVMERCAKYVSQYCNRFGCQIVYDAEALYHVRDILYEAFAEANKGWFVPQEQRRNRDVNATRARELSAMRYAHAVVTVSSNEQRQIQAAGVKAPVFVIGHVKDPSTDHQLSFSERSGVLFVGAFHKNMYYNGDAIRWFLERCYSNVAAPLTIAGFLVPRELKDYVKSRTDSHRITILDNVDDLSELYATHRVFIAPHQYACGIQYKVSESLSFGLPTVMSKVTYNAFGFNDGDATVCSAADPAGLVACVNRVHNDQGAWESMRANSRKFIETTHSKVAVTRKWREVFQTLQSTRQREMEEKAPAAACYAKRYPDVKAALCSSTPEDSEIVLSCDVVLFGHFIRYGRREGRIWGCESDRPQRMLPTVPKHPLWVPPKLCESAGPAKHVALNFCPPVKVNYSREHYEKFAGEQPAHDWFMLDAPAIMAIIAQAVQPSFWVVNLGAWPTSTSEDDLRHVIYNGDDVTPLYSMGYHGVNFDTPNHRKIMMEFYSKWPKAIVDLRTPSPVEIGFALVVRHAVPKNLDFLKIDVDSYDCEYLKAILAAGYSPKAVDIELTPSIPPPLKYMLKWNPEYPVFGSILGGCSLSMAMDIIQPYGYTLIQYAMEDGWFVKDEYAHLFGSVHPDPTDLYELGNPDHYAPNIWTGDINGSSMVEELVHLRGNPAAMLARAQEGIRKTIAESEPSDNLQRMEYILAL